MRVDARGAGPADRRAIVKRLTCDGCKREASPLKLVDGRWICAGCRK